MLRTMKACAFLMLAATITFIECFHNAVPPSLLRKEKHGLITPPFVGIYTIQKSYRMSVTKEDKMTAQDEEIFFGSSTSTPDPPFPARHRYVSKTGNILEDTNLPLDPLDHSKTNKLINALHTMRETLHCCPAVWSQLTKLCPDNLALIDEHSCDTKVELTFKQAETAVRKSATVFQSLGVEKGTNVAVFGENSAYWLLIDHGIQLAGGVSAVRGADAPPEELLYIYEHCDSKGIAVLQNAKLLQRMGDHAKKHGLKHFGFHNKYGDVHTVILMHRGKTTDETIAQMEKEYDIKIHVFGDLLEKTEPTSYDNLPLVGDDDLATIVYTSGTTGQPKGVMLSHGNLLHQIGHRTSLNQPYEETEPLPDDVMLCLLPVWHITERTFELFILTRGCTAVYSSIRTFKNDLAKYRPHWLVLVPRVLEKVAAGVQAKFSSGSKAVQALSKLFTAVASAKSTNLSASRGLVVGDDALNPLQKLKSTLITSCLTPIDLVGNKLIWSKVQEGFGGRLKLVVSGGSALPGSLESFYENCGIPIIVGYGLTECSPLIAHRRQDCNLITAGCVGQPTLDTEIRVVDPDAIPTSTQERTSLPDGTPGKVIVRGPQVMKGYYKNPDATNKAIDSFGWFDTGDLGRINPLTGDLILTGRCKDTIVLSNGENIEPIPIEDAILGQCAYIDQVMLTGQDGRSLVAIIVLNPTELANSGFLDANQAKTLQKEQDKVNDPKCTEEDCNSGCEVLLDASQTLKNNANLKEMIMKDLRKATSDFRPWEQVGDVLITLEPFAMANRLLTQSYKVKRDSVTEHYSDELGA